MGVVSWVLLLVVQVLEYSVEIAALLVVKSLGIVGCSLYKSISSSMAHRFLSVTYSSSSSVSSSSSISIHASQQVWHVLPAANKRGHGGTQHFVPMPGATGRVVGHGDPIQARVGPRACKGHGGVDRCAATDSRRRARGDTGGP